MSYASNFSAPMTSPYLQGYNNLKPVAGSLVPMVMVPANSPAAMAMMAPTYSQSVMVSPTMNPQAATANNNASGQIGGAYGIKNIGTQQYIPIGEKREFTKEEEADVQRGLNRWFPALVQSYGTKATDMLAHPLKKATIAGGITAVIGAIVGGVAGKSSAGGVIGALVGLIFGGFVAYIDQLQENGTILDLMKRLPPGASKRDILSDPVFQKDRELAAIRAQGSGSTSSNLATAAIIGSMMSNK